MDGVLVRLMHSLQALAASAEVQVALFPDFVVKADELALDFDHWRSVVLGRDERLSDRQKHALDVIDEKLSVMTQSRDQRLWTIEALRSHSAWTEVRGLARDALRAFGWPDDRPPSYAHEYVPGG